jgi:hypothetical protein
MSHSSSASPNFCPVPASIMRASQQELNDLKLNIEGTLPDDLYGHVFIVAPVGSVDSGGLPYPDGDSLLNGDGMVYRLDFDRPNEVHVTTRIVKPPDYYADLATQKAPYTNYRFRNHGIARISFQLGIRNQLNTAFLPIPFSPEESSRLLVTYDAGRPYEIDPETLELITPIGSNQEWQGELDRLTFPIDAAKFPFKSILSTAHPAFDAIERQMFTVNYGRSFSNFLAGIRLLYSLEAIPEFLETLLTFIFGFLQIGVLKNLLRSIFQGIGRLFYGLIRVIEHFSGNELPNFTYLIRWNGGAELERWRLVLPNGKPVRIEQTIHQIGVTQDYVVIMDTAFVTGFEQILNNPFPKNKRLETLLRNLLESPASPESRVYLVRRQDLVNGQHPAHDSKVVDVVAQPVVIPLEAAHFLVDYDNPNGNVTLHVAHICAMQVAEWLRKNDVSAYDLQTVPAYLFGMEHDEVDIGRMGRYVIHAETGAIVSSQVITDLTCTWAVDLYTYPDLSSMGSPPRQLHNIYWGSFGLWKQLMTSYIFDLYRDYKYRLVPVEQLLQFAATGKPACLFRLETKTMSIADHYEFPCGCMSLSPQFIPRQNSQNETDGYLICTACFAERNELWIFDANHLAQGPLCRLHHPDLQFGFTLHTTWLPTIRSQRSHYLIPVEEDYKTLVQDYGSEAISELFKTEIYPHFNQNS